MALSKILVEKNMFQQSVTKCFSSIESAQMVSDLMHQINFEFAQKFMSAIPQIGYKVEYPHTGLIHPGLIHGRYPSQRMGLVATSPILPK